MSEGIKSPNELWAEARRLRGLACELRSQIENLELEVCAAWEDADSRTPRFTSIDLLRNSLSDAAELAGETEDFMDEHFPDPEEEQQARAAHPN